MDTTWKRPDDVPFPNIWKKFKGRILENGHYNDYRIQEVTEDMIEDAVTHLVKYFLITEIITSSVGVVEDEVSLEEFRKFWRKALKQKMSLVALVEDGKDENGKEKVKIAGLNVLLVEKANEEKSVQVFGKPASKVFSLLDWLEKESSVFQRHMDITYYLKGMGLSVNPAYKKDNVGYELLIARDDMCRRMNITLSGTAFTGAASQHLATKAGYTTVVAHMYGDYTENGEIMFPRITDQCIKFMEKIIK